MYHYLVPARGDVPVLLLNIGLTWTSNVSTPRSSNYDNEEHRAPTGEQLPCLPWTCLATMLAIRRLSHYVNIF
jgi:hypothetical protein